jgi:hypothetical protein
MSRFYMFFFTTEDWQRTSQNIYSWIETHFKTFLEKQLFKHKSEYFYIEQK